MVVDSTMVVDKFITRGLLWQPMNMAIPLCFHCVFVLLSTKCILQVPRPNVQCRSKRIILTYFSMRRVRYDLLLKFVDVKLLEERLIC